MATNMYIVTDKKKEGYCKCEYAVFTPPADPTEPLRCKKCGKLISIYKPCISEERAKQLEEIATTAAKQSYDIIESFNPVPATEEQQERLRKLCEGLVKVELTPIQKMSDNELFRKLEIARRNVEKWHKRVEDIQNERSRRYRHWKSMQEPEW